MKEILARTVHREQKPAPRTLKRKWYFFGLLYTEFHTSNTNRKVHLHIKTFQLSGLHFKYDSMTPCSVKTIKRHAETFIEVHKWLSILVHILVIFADGMHHCRHKTQKILKRMHFKVILRHRNCKLWEIKYTTSAMTVCPSIDNLFCAKWSVYHKNKT